VAQGLHVTLPDYCTFILGASSTESMWSLEVSRSIREDVECKLRCINFRRVSNARRALLLALRVTGISDYRYRSTKREKMIDLGIPQSAGEHFGSFYQHLQGPTASPRVQTTNPGVLTTSLQGPRSPGDMSANPSNHSSEVWETEHLPLGCCRCAWNSYLLLIIQLFLKLMYAGCIHIYVSI